MGNDEPSGPAAETRNFQEPESFGIVAQGQELTFYPGGPDRLAALLDLIEGAQSSIKLCFYIFAEDKAGHRVRDALIAAARRGVGVDLIIDGFGATAGDSFFIPLTEAGGRHWCFSARWSRRYLIRNHQKIAIADGRRAIIGGFNVEDSYFATPWEGGWHDLGVRLEGSCVEMLDRWFDQLLERVQLERGQFRAIRRMVREWNPGNGTVQLLIGGPTRGLSSWARCVGRDLEQGERLDMLMAYFSPSNRLLRRIGRIARKGQTRLVMAAKSDNNATIGATRSLYDYLLKHRARIWEFSPCKLHAKLIVLDDCIYIGSANFDMRSLYLNLEVMLRIEDSALADRMREFVSQHLPHSEAITPRLHKQRATLWNRVRWNLGWALVSVVDYTVSRKLNLGL